MNTATELAKLHNGVITTWQISDAGIARSRLSEAVKAGELVRAERGVYLLPDTWDDEFLLIQERFSCGIFSDETALHLLDFTDRTPERLTMTFPRSYNASAVRKKGITVRTCAPNVLELGLTQLITPYGNPVRAYDLERTLCDLVRGRATPNEQVLNPAMKRYAASKYKNIPKLFEYAKKLGVLAKVRRYMEVLL